MKLHFLIQEFIHAVVQSSIIQIHFQVMEKILIEMNFSYL